MALAIVLAGCAGLLQPAPRGKVYAAAVLPPSGCAPPEKGDWIVPTEQACADGGVVLNGNLNVTGKLVLRNVTLLVNASRDGEFAVSVAGNASLLVENSRVESWSGWSYVFFVEKGAGLRISGSVVSGAGYGDEVPGLVVQAADVLVRGTNWTDAGKSMPANATRWANQSGVPFASKSLLAESDATVYYSLVGSGSFTAYFQLRPPSGTPPGTYSQNVTFTSIC
ncbi:MAG: hypothetical protein QXH27_00220 [Candidatus Micrarchaeia archaeon]